MHESDLELFSHTIMHSLKKSTLHTTLTWILRDHSSTITNLFFFFLTALSDISSLWNGCILKTVTERAQ
jgi:hypothetical protein